MDPENVINLFDSYWFDHQILKSNNFNSSSKSSLSSSTEPKFSSLRSILLRSKSEDISSSFNYGSFSPSSVLFTSNLQTINSGKRDDFKIEKPEQEEEEEEEPETRNKNERVLLEKKKSKRQSGTSKSLSELEFEELKGFMDLGFVFSEQDKDDSSLVEIIPGLQRLGENKDSNSSSASASATSRPYLSEAWKDLDRKINYHALMMNWEIPAVKDEIDMKDNLKLWAHTVASFVR